MMNIFKGHFEFTKNIFRLNQFEFHLIVGFEHPHFKFQKNLNMMQQDAHTRQYQKVGMWQLTPTKQESHPEIQDAR